MSFGVEDTECKTYRHGKCCANCSYLTDDSCDVWTDLICTRWDNHRCIKYAVCDEWKPHENIAEEYQEDVERGLYEHR